ncbi:biopolymer transporter ExbD [bacterium]|nr:biopolymer transporter ExbD [bacterium]
MFVKKYKKYGHIKPEINLTSMIDVMCILMSVFMVTAPMLTTGMSVNLPTGAKTAIEGAEKSVNIVIDKVGNIYIGKEKILRKNLKGKLQAMLKQNPSLSIVISGDTNTQYGKVIEIMGDLKTAGFKKVGLKTDPMENKKG